MFLPLEDKCTCILGLGPTVWEICVKAKSDRLNDWVNILKYIHRA